MNDIAIANANRTSINRKALAGIKAHRRLVEVFEDFEEIISLYGPDYLYASLASIIVDYHEFANGITDKRDAR